MDLLCHVEGVVGIKIIGVLGTMWSRHEGIISRRHRGVLEALTDCALRCVIHAAIVRPFLGDRGEGTILQLSVPKE